MAGRLPRVTGATGSIDTTGEGYFWGVTIAPPFVQTGVVASSGDLVRVIQFVLPFRAKVSTLVFEVTTLDASSLTAVGIYNEDGNSLLVDSGAVDSSGTGNKSVTLSSAITLEPGVYWQAQTSDSTTVQARLINLFTAANIDILNENNTYIGTAANSSSSGVLPATLGTITGATISPVAVLFEP